MTLRAIVGVVIQTAPARGVTGCALNFLQLMAVGRAGRILIVGAGGLARRPSGVEEKAIGAHQYSLSARFFKLA